MNKTIKTILVFVLCYLTACSMTLPSTGDHITATQSLTRISIPAQSSTSTSLPDQLLTDIFLSGTTGGNLKIISDGADNDVDAKITSDCLHTGNYGVKLNYKVNPAVTRYHGALWGVFLKNLSAWIDIKGRRSLELWESARFQAVCVAQSWFHHSGVVSSRAPAGNAHR